MKNLGLAGFVPVIIALGGCTAMAINSAGNELADYCTEMGEELGVETRIAPKYAGSRGGMFGNVVVSGVCLSPEEEGYEDAMTIEEYRASPKKPPA